ncbi:MAG: hypothetical protein KDA61_11535, partial [Planctomycetales bacterium]|nr:hypothetical protein [Planctomycetales bacterium]
GLLRLGAFPSRKGASARLNVMVRGDEAASVDVKVVSVYPEELQVQLEPGVARGNKLMQAPLIVSIPAGTRPMALTGDNSGIAAEVETSTDRKEGEIVLSTTHPTAPEVRLRVQFAVTP